MDWTEVTLTPLPEKLDSLCNRLVFLGYDAFSVEDEGQFLDFLEDNRRCWDYIDREFEEKLRGLSQIKLYIENSGATPELMAALDAGIEDLGKISSTTLIRDEDWENNWKQYYKPLPVGRRLLICPEWETPGEVDGRVLLRLDPGTIFGTGTHATTRLCLETLEDVVKGGEQVLDLGCGSGILSIAALLLGAKTAAGIDIDPRGRHISSENALLNGLDCNKYEAITGDVTGGHLRERFSREKSDIVLANIVSDVILAIVPVVPELLKDGGVFICSGIIAPRAQEVRETLNTVFSSVEERSDEDWHAFICK